MKGGRQRAGSSVVLRMIRVARLASSLVILFDADAQGSLRLPSWASGVLNREAKGSHGAEDLLPNHFCKADGPQNSRHCTRTYALHPHRKGKYISSALHPLESIPLSFPSSLISRPGSDACLCCTLVAIVQLSVASCTADFRMGMTQCPFLLQIVEVSLPVR
jgi:hypothetical protein